MANQYKKLQKKLYEKNKPDDKKKEPKIGKDYPILILIGLTIRKHHIRISFVVPPCKYINTQPILLLYLCCSVILICINAFSISIIHAGYNMHILLPQLF